MEFQELFSKLNEGKLAPPAVSEESIAGGEQAATINELQQQLQSLSQEKEQAIQGLRAEFAERENGRLVYDQIVNRLAALQQPGEGKAGRRLSVDQQHAARAILRELGEEFVLRYDEESKDIAVYSKAVPEERASEGQKLVAINELIERSLVRNNWIAQSNGGSVSPQRFFSRAKQHEMPQQNEGSEFRKRLEEQVDKLVG